MNTSLPNQNQFKDLNEKQIEAVTLQNESALILAGAGSGKTKVLTSRISWLIQTNVVSPFGLIAVTFTNKAAKEMQSRLIARAHAARSALVADGQRLVETAVRDGRTMRMFHRETDAAKVRSNRDAIFDLHARSLAFMAEYTGIAYPFDKYDQLFVPEFNAGAMENAGCVTFTGWILLATTRAAAEPPMAAT